MGKKIFFVLVASFFASPVPASAQEPADTQPEERLYNFDDMLIDGAFRDPQGMFERSRAEAKFDSVLHIERSFLHRTEENAQESAMQP